MPAQRLEASTLRVQLSAHGLAGNGSFPPIQTFRGRTSNVRKESISLKNSVAAEIGDGQGRSLPLGPETSFPIKL